MWVNFRCKFLAEVGQFYAPINNRCFYCAIVIVRDSDLFQP